MFHGTGEPTDQIAGHVLQCGERAARTVEIAGKRVAPVHSCERVHQFVGVPLRTIPGARVLDDRVDHSVFVQFARIERAGGDGVLHVMHAVGDVIGQVHHLAFDGTAGGVGRVLFEPGEHVRIIRIDAEFRTALPFRMRGGFGKRPRVFDGRIERGTIHANQEIAVCNYHDPDAAPRKAKAVSMYQFEGLQRVPVQEATAGNIIAMSGIGDITIGDTICAPEAVEPIEFVKISAPTMEMTFSVNDSPFAGREGKFVTSRQIRERLFRETLKDVSLHVSELEGSTDSFVVAGRGEMHLSILIETMRREGYEFSVSPPRVLYQTIDGKKCEPIERVVVDVPSEYIGAVIEKLGSRKGEFVEMNPVGARTKATFLVPERGLFGYRNEFLTDTKGEGIMSSVFECYEPYKGELSRRGTGSLVAWEQGEAVTYGLFNAQERGALFIGPGTPVYAGMIVGVSPKNEDIPVNVCRKKQLTNMRAAGSDEALRLTPPRQLSLEQCLEFLADDELLEVTPKNLRLRKRILDHSQRMKALKGNKA